MRKLPDIRQFKRIAIIQTAFLGDVALALYLAEMIKKIHPLCELTFVTTPAAAGLVNCAKSVDFVVTFDKRGLHTGWKGIKLIAGILGNKRIDCIFGLQRSLRTSIVVYLSKPVCSVGFDKAALSFLYRKRVKYVLGEHEIFRNSSMLNAFKQDDISDVIQQDSKLWGIEYDVSDYDKFYIDNLLINCGIESKDKLIAVAPGSVWETKRWPVEYFEILIRHLKEVGYEPVMIGSKDDVELVNVISSGTGVVSLAGKTNLPQLLHFLSLCNLTITNDSSPTHFAGLVKCPALTIFGATVPEFGFSPLGPFDRSVGIEGLKCRPCGIHGGRKCPVKTFDCMVKLKPEIVFNIALNILRANA